MIEVLYSVRKALPSAKQPTEPLVEPRNCSYLFILFYKS